MMKMRGSMRLTILVTTLLLLSPVWAASEVKVTARHGQSVRGTMDDLPFVVLRGTSQERGEAYGALCGKDVTVLLDGMMVPLVQKRVPNGWGLLMTMANSTFRFDARTLEQMAAFIEGFKKTVPQEQRLIKSLDRELTVDDLKLFQCFGDMAGTGRVPMGGCSSFSAWGALTADGQAIMGRNTDYTTFPGHFECMVIAQEPTEAGVPRTLEISGPGIFGASTSMNEEGVVIALHDEGGLPAPAGQKWTPRVMALRKAIESAHLMTAKQDIVSALQNTPLAMGGNIHVSMPIKDGGPRPFIVEWDGNSASSGVTVREAKPDLTAVYCTNHFLERRKNDPKAGGSSRDRLRKLEGFLQRSTNQKATIDVATAEKMMDAVAVNGGSTTYYSVVVLPTQRTLAVAASTKSGVSATKGHWVDVEWGQVFGAK